MVCSLSAKGLTHGEICAHLAEIYGAQVSKETITRITDRVLEGMTEWQNRPLDRVYPVVFIDCIHVKIRDGQVANRPIYVALGVTVDGERDILGLWVGTGGGRRQVLVAGAHRDQEPGGGRRLHRGVRRAGRASRCVITATWPRAVVQTCVIHLLRNRFVTPPGVTGRRSPGAAPGLHRPDRGRRAGASRRLLPGHGRRDIRRSSSCGRTHGPEFVPSFLAFDPEIRAIIYTTNAIESPSTPPGSVGRCKARGHFPNEQASPQMLVPPVIRSLDPTGRGRKRWTNRWKPALNAFTITFEGRIVTNNRAPGSR